MTTVSNSQPGRSGRKQTRVRERKPRGRGLRTRTGCLTCRKRHLKCDEVKDVCGHCARSNHTCVYPDPSILKPGPRSLSVLASDSVASPIDSSVGILSRRSTSEADEDELDDFESLKPLSNESSRPNWSQQSSKTRWNSPPLGNGSSFGPQQGGGHSPRGRYLQSLLRSSLCYHGFYNQFLEDENAHLERSPSLRPPANGSLAKSFALLEAGLENSAASLTLGEEDVKAQSNLPTDTIHGIPDAQNAQYRSDRSSEINFVGTPSSTSEVARAFQLAHSEHRLWQSTEPLSLRPHEVTIFNHFMTQLSQWFDLFDPMRQFSILVPHLAMHNFGLLNAILALSARHLSLEPAAENSHTPTQNDALAYYHETLQYVQRAMQFDSYNTSDELHATCLIVSAYEMFDGSLRDWQRHLQGVFWIQQSQHIHGDSPDLKGAVWWAWLAQDVWAAFRQKRKPLITWTPTKQYSDLNAYEFAARSVYLMSRVVAYCAQEEVERGEHEIKTRLLEAKSLAEMLDEWQQHLPIEFNTLPLESSREGSTTFKPIFVNPPAFGVAIQIHNAAQLLLLLHRPCLNGYGKFMQQQPEVTRCVQTICGLAKTIQDDASTIMSAQCLFIAGLCIRDQHQRKEVVRLLDDRRNCSHWPSNSLSAELETIWNESVDSPLS